MSRQWTEQQLQAITTHHKSLLVAAAAGSGKTAVLVERIIAMITAPHDPISIDTLLVVTFTNAAASEMRERISQALQEALQQNPQSEHLYQQSLHHYTPFLLPGTGAQPFLPTGYSTIT